MDPSVVFVPVGDVPVSGFYFQDAFTGSDVLESSWVSSSGTATEAVLTARSDTNKPTGGIAGIGPGADAVGSGALRLTGATQSAEAFVLFDNAFASDQGVNVTFDLFAYGGTEGGNPPSLGDGLSFFLIDGDFSGTIEPGSTGGSLGYSSSASRAIGGTPAPGLTAGYLGIGFDEFGNFSEPLDSAPGGPGRVLDSIAVRGRAGADRVSGYEYLTGTTTLAGGIDNPDSGANRANSRRMIEIDLSGDGILDVSIDLNNDGVFEASERVINDFNVAAVNGSVPANYKFGFASSTGGATNIHEIRNLAIAPSKASDAGTRPTGEGDNPVTFGEFGVGATYVENAVPQQILAGLTIEGTPGPINGATVQITNNRNAAQDILTIGGNPATTSGTVTGTTINWTYDAASGTLTFTGAGTQAQYRDALRSVAYANNSDAPTTDDRTVRYTLLNGSTPITVRDTLVKINAVDDLPVATLSSNQVPIGQAGAVVGTFALTDVDGPTPNANLTYGAGPVSGGNDKFEIVNNNGTLQLKLKDGQSVGAGETIPAITASFIDDAPDDGGSIVGNFDLTPGTRNAEIFWRNTPQQKSGYWYIENNNLKGAALLTGDPYFDASWELVGVGDLDNDGVSDHVYQRGSEIGYLFLGETNGQTATVKSTTAPTFNNAIFGSLNNQAANQAPGWELVGVANITGNAAADLIFYSRGLDRVAYWENNGAGQIIGGGVLTSSAAPQGQGTGGTNSTWNVEAVADFTGDGNADIFWRNGTTNQTALWALNGTVVNLTSGSGTGFLGVVSADFKLEGVGDFDGNGTQDIVWRSTNSTGLRTTRFWSFNSAGLPTQADDTNLAGAGFWEIGAVADVNGDGKSDLIWRDTLGDRAALWLSNFSGGATFTLSDIIAAGSGFINQDGTTTPIVTGDLAWNIDSANGIPVVTQVSA